MDLGLTGKTALAREGCNVAICARGEDGLRQAVEELRASGIQAVGVQADVTTEDGTTRLFNEATDVLGPVDVLVNNVVAPRAATSTPPTTRPGSTPCSSTSSPAYA